MAKRSVQIITLSPVATADTTTDLADATYPFLARGASSIQRTAIIEVYLGGQASAAAPNYMLLARSAQLGTGTNALSANQTDAPLDSATAALAAPVLTGTTNPTLKPRRSTTEKLLNLSFNAFGGLVRWVAAPGEEIYIVGNTASLGEITVSSYTGSTAGGYGRPYDLRDDLMPYFTNRGITPLPVGGGGGAWLLDQITPQPTAAYSTRKLKSSATNALRLCNLSGGAGTGTNIVGFDGSDDLDTAIVDTYYAANTSCANCNGFYDQSGNGRDFLSAVIANSAVLKLSTVDSGAIQTINSHPAVYFSDAVARVTLDSTLHLSDVMTSTAFTIIQSLRIAGFFTLPGATKSGGFLADGNNGYFGSGCPYNSGTNGNFAQLYFFDSGSHINFTTSVAINTTYIFVTRFSSPTLSLYINGGAAATSVTGSGAIGDMGYQLMTMGTGVELKTLEILVYNTALSNADINTLCSAGSVTNGNVASRAGVTWTSM